MKSYWPILLIFCSFITNSVHAEVYRWVDNEGNVHFSDKKPAQTDAEDISDKLSKTNIDESSKAMQRLERVLSESVGEKQIRGKQEQKARLEQEHRMRVCKKAREELRILKGRVVFVDEDGKSYNISEEERKTQAAQLEAEITTRCS